MSPIQKSALYGLVISLSCAIAILILFIVKGATSYHEDASFRIIVTCLFLASFFPYGIMLKFTWRKSADGKINVDERDKKAMERAPSVQLFAVIITLVVWAIALTEVYWDQGQLPIAFPYLIFFSCMIINIIAHSAGILIGYWRIGRTNGEE